MKRVYIEDTEGRVWGLADRGCADPRSEWWLVALVLGLLTAAVASVAIVAMVAMTASVASEGQMQTEPAANPLEVTIIFGDGERQKVIPSVISPSSSNLEGKKPNQEEPQDFSEDLLPSAPIEEDVVEENPGVTPLVPPSPTPTMTPTPTPVPTSLGDAVTGLTDAGCAKESQNSFETGVKLVFHCPDGSGKVIDFFGESWTISDLQDFREVK